VEAPLELDEELLLDELEELELEDELLDDDDELLELELEEDDELLEPPLWSCTTASVLVTDPAELETTTE
jgi:hypothetical protein